MALKHFKSLDGVRGIAALMVMFFHFFSGLNTQSHLLGLLAKYSVFGQTGVSLFFVLSGFLITRILLHTKESPYFFRNFYIRRTLRIFPLYYLFLALVFFVVPLLQNIRIAPFSEQVWYWVYLQNIAITFEWKNAGPIHFWSLAVEEHFYLFWPLVVYCLEPKKIKVVIAVLIAAAFITRIILVNNGLETFYFTLARMDELAVGALLAILETEGKLKPSNANKFIWLFLLLIIPTLILWVLSTGQKLAAIQVSKYALLSFCYFSLTGFIISVKENHLIIKSLRLFSYTGKISYGLYVYHPLCFFLIGYYFKIQSVLLLFLASFAFSYLAATLSFYLFENKFLTLKEKLTKTE